MYDILLYCGFGYFGPQKEEILTNLMPRTEMTLKQEVN